jgi:hypothetical protein
MPHELCTNRPSYSIEKVKKLRWLPVGHWFDQLQISDPAGGERYRTWKKRSLSCRLRQSGEDGLHPFRHRRWREGASGSQLITAGRTRIADVNACAA